MIELMANVRVTEAELARDIHAVLAKVQEGIVGIVEQDHRPVAIIRPAEPVRRKISECIGLMPRDSIATVDPDFAKDIEAVIASHREPLDPQSWD